MSYKLNWTYPNLGKYYRHYPPIRGTLNERYKDALKLNLSRIEVPFDLIREENNEYLVVQKPVGDIPTKNDFPKLYGEGRFEKDYILHTDPELKPSHILYWNLPKWRNTYLESIVEFSYFIGKPPCAVEFHPSKPKRSREHMIKLILEAFDKFKELNFLSSILIENRTGMFISTVEDMIKFYETVSDNLSSKELSKFGFCIDISQLYTQIKRDPSKDLKKLPKSSILGWHIHYKHKPPSDKDPINWKEIISMIKPNVFCLPEVFRFKDIIATIKYIENLINENKITIPQ